MKYLKNHSKLYITAFTAASLFVLISCSPARNDSRQQSTQTQQQQLNNQNNNPDAGPAVGLTEDTATPDETGTTEPAAETTDQSTANESTSQVMINPPHGQPGHRCDIPVGQPLNSTEPAAETTSQSTANSNTSQVMINPPHGQPGHRCDIPVGQPLNSAPANNTTATSNTAPSLANNPMAPTIENARRLNGSQTRTTTTTNTGTKPRLNPPHGQPWHRCDIPVGQPLP